MAINSIMMKKIIFALILFVFISVAALAWDDCPEGEVWCEGKCGLFVDTDNDGICDRPQPAPEERNAQATEEEIHDLISGQDLRTKTVNEVAEIYQIDANEYAEKLSKYLGANVKPEDSFELLHDNYGLEPSAAKDISTSIRLGTQIDLQEKDNKQNKKIYHLLPISLFLVLLYLVSHVLSKKNIISIVNHRKIWNILLLITFLISGILGILLIIRINLGTAIPLPFNIMFWHVEAGIAMFAISIFHIFWHWAYFKNLLRIKK